MAGRSSSWKSDEPLASSDADQVEFNALKALSSVLDDAANDEIISGEIDDEVEEIGDVGPGWKGLDLAKEGMIDATRKEIERRSKLLGQYYPFEVDASKLVYRGSESGFYEFCLAISSAKNITTGRFTELPRTFERSVAYLVKRYFGWPSKALHTGFPRTPSSSFKQAMSKLEKESLEWIWGPRANLLDSDIKDESLDFVVTVGQLDNRAGGLYVLGQCACGNDWGGKVDEPDLSKLERWFHPPWVVPPVKAFTTPFAIGDRTLESTVTQSKALVLDRTRLAFIAETMLSKKSKMKMKKVLQPVTDLV